MLEHLERRLEQGLSISPFHIKEAVELVTLMRVLDARLDSIEVRLDGLEERTPPKAQQVPAAITCGQCIHYFHMDGSFPPRGRCITRQNDAPAVSVVGEQAKPCSGSKSVGDDQ